MSKEIFAPVVLFVYNRPDHTRRTLEALSRNTLADKTTLYIFADGAKENANVEQIKKIEEVRALIKENKWCKECYIFESDKNKGLADSIIEGVSKIVKEHGRVIVLEDDIETSEGFLTFMNSALEIYAEDELVMQINGYIYPVDTSKIEQSTFFVNVPSCWGWATWARAWKHYNNDIDFHLKKLNTSKQIKRFNVMGHGDFYEQILQNKSGKIKTWAVRWYASWFFAGGYSLFPKMSLTQNIGFDGSGVHCGERDTFDIVLGSSLNVERQEIVENVFMRRKIDAFFKSNTPYLKNTIIKVAKKMGIYTLLRSIKTKLKRR